MSMLTLQQALTYFTDLAREHGADILTTIGLQYEGAILIIHWTGNRDSDLPREAWLYFGKKGDDLDSFLWASVIDPVRFLWATDEGLDDTQILNHCCMMVESVTETENYLLGKPYRAVTPSDSTKSALPSGSSLTTPPEFA